LTSIGSVSRAEGRHLRADPVEDLLAGPAGLALDHRRLVLVGEQVGRAVDEVADQVTLAEGELLARVGDEAVAALPALAGVPEHALGVVGGDQHEVGRTDLRHDRRELHQPGLAHRPGIEGGELRHRAVRGAHETRRVPGVGDAHVRAVDAVPLEPAAVVGEVLTGRADQHRTQPEAAQAEAHVGGHSPAPDLEVVDQEGDRDLVELVDDQGVLEPSGEGHQVVGGDGSADQQGHVREHYRPTALGVLIGSR
jgi:hypothetical protein